MYYASHRAVRRGHVRHRNREPRLGSLKQPEQHLGHQEGLEHLVRGVDAVLRNDVSDVLDKLSLGLAQQIGSKD
jgi:hypothetical protein